MDLQLQADLHQLPCAHACCLLRSVNETDFSLTVWFNAEEYDKMSLPLRVAFRVLRDPLLMPGLWSVGVFFVFPFFTRPKEAFLCKVLPFLIAWSALGLETAINCQLGMWIGGAIGIALFREFWGWGG